MSDINDLLNRLSKVRQTGAGKWISCCPAHEDKSPSLSVRQADDRILIYCFAGCSVDDVVSSVGMSLSDLMPESLGHNKPFEGVPKYNKSDLFDVMVTETSIMVLAARQLALNVKLNPVDLQRVRLSEERLDSIIAKVGKA